MSITIPVERGCGQRKAGGVYLECGFSTEGNPISAFLYDPPLSIDIDRLGITDIGVHLVRNPQTGMPHVVNIVGQKSYPNPADYVEEVARFGLSVRAQRTFPFHELSEGSMVICLHRKAIITNATDYYRAISDEMDYASAKGREEIRPAFRCRKHLPDHRVSELTVAGPMCCGLWWEDVDGGDLVVDPDQPPRSITRRMPSFSYLARKRPLHVKPHYTPGAFAAFPIQNIAVICGANGIHDQGVSAVEKSPLPWSLVDR